ncbi:MAG: 16S rRNA (cytosine(1402)-N(4))-methyltransferase RsmH [Verrucomicrobia bacterium]|nr:16S rRNA (cytosine(1402)-N(4))-methyltransferase RsmH [Verrucomicrobiota bacterium]MBS0636611.1 16S rRNA (cytosine(1402)-N(4))-methyltransferase RsmH [Verrucomicrobiota bacterium]
MFTPVHISVLQDPILELFKDKKLNSFIDATLGAAGHSLAMLKAHPELTCLIGFDRDPSALEIARSLLPEGSILIHSNFRHLKRNVSTQVDGILFDIGVSSMQLDQAARGFSFMQDGPLDMRMDSTQTFTAEDVVNSYPEDKLANVIYEYGEEHASRRIAKAIVQARRKERIVTTQRLVAVIETVLPRRGKIHPATKTFQALRIEVNAELDSLKDALDQALELLAPGGILAVISFHSLEDRIVKNHFRAQDKEQFLILTKKPTIASDAECRANPRSRSAKLRAIQKI